MTGTLLIQNLVNGISLGSLYALIAIGYTMVYGILRLINFAHGEVFMIGAYAAFYLLTANIMPWWLAFLVGALITGILGVAIEKAAYSPLRNSPRITVLISAIGVSFLLQNLGLLVFGARPKAFPVPEFLLSQITISNNTFGDIKLSMISIITPLITFVLLAILTLIISKTKTGIAMRALSVDFETASLMGVNVNRVISMTFFIGSFLAAIGGMLFTSRYPQLVPHLGAMPGMKCFIAAVVGGIGSLPGAVIGGFMLGILEIMLVAVFSSLTGWRDAISFVLLIVILLVKPSGLMGEKTTEKV
ncbi:MAG: branched-chain amino acid ABC transporter permease [Tissierellia bacterium]|nr:branched-chain amino acid ABC transporter permease [Tissierellia bacterium]